MLSLTNRNALLVTSSYAMGNIKSVDFDPDREIYKNESNPNPNEDQLVE